GMEGNAVGVGLIAALVKKRRKIRAATEPGFAGDDKPGVHVHRWHVRVVQMRDKRNARCPETRVSVGAWNLLAEFRRELAVHGRTMPAALLEDASVHHCYDAPTTRCATMVGSLPRRMNEPARRTVGERGFRGQRIFQHLEGRANIITQRFEPGSRARLAGFKLSRVHQRLQFASYLIPIALARRALF